MVNHNTLINQGRMGLMRITATLPDKPMVFLLARVPRVVHGILLGATWMVAGYWASQWLAPAPHTLARNVDSIAPVPPRWISLYTLPDNSISIQLRGVISAGSKGVALLSVDHAKPQSYRVGQNVAPGVILRQVALHQVTLERQAGEEIVKLPAVPSLKGLTLVAPRLH